MSNQIYPLIDAYLDGTIAPAELPLLNELLARDADAVLALTRRAQVDFELAARFSADEAHRRGEALLVEAIRSVGAPASRVDVSSPLFSLGNLRAQYERARAFAAKPSSLSLIVAASVMVALIAAMAYIGAPIYVHMTRTPPPDTPAIVGRLTGIFNAEWEGIQIGGSLDAHVLKGNAYRLKSGVIEVTLAGGALVVVQGPAAVAFDSDNSARVRYGKVVSHVPVEAHGFALHAPQAKIIDLGTSFGVAASKANNDLFIEVFEGSIHVRVENNSSLAPFTMRMGERISLRGGQRLPPEQQPTFVHNLPGTERGPAVLVGFYPFEGNAHDESGNNRHGNQVSDVAWTDGYEGRGATFAGTRSSFIDLPIDATCESIPILTWGAWVRPTAVSGPRIIFSTDNNDFDRALAIDPRIGYEMTEVSRFCAHGGQIAGALPSRSPQLPTEDEWTFVAAEYDAPAKQVTLLVENEYGDLHRDMFRDALPGEALPFVRVGMHPLGYSEAFSGTIDNVFIFRGRLDPNQLLTIQRGGAEAVLKMGAQFRSAAGK